MNLLNYVVLFCLTGSRTYLVLIVWFDDISAVGESVDDKVDDDKPEIKVCHYL